MNNINPGVQVVIDQSAVVIQQKFFDFLLRFEIRRGEEGYEQFRETMTVEGEAIRVYVQEAEKLIRNDKQTMDIDYRHLVQYDQDRDLTDAIVDDYYRYEKHIRKAVYELIFRQNPEHAKDKQFSVSFLHLDNVEKLRDLKTARIGKLMELTGTVTRTTEVRPELISGCFRCQSCGATIRDMEQQFRYTEPQMCVNEHCGNKTKWELLVNESTFVDWQKLRVQENAGDIPPGSMPRSIDIILRSEVVDKAKPGDKCIFTGQLVVVPDIVSLLKPGERTQASKRGGGGRKEGNAMEGVSGLKRLGVRDLSYKLTFMATSIRGKDTRFGFKEEDSDDLAQFSKLEQNRFMQMRNESNVYERLAKSIAPSVFGHLEVKKGILLMLFGGVTKETHDGIKLRGDINECIVGDPSTAKSQFLKYVVSFLPRAIYTSGKSSTAAGLTASVVRDPESGEFCLEAGALMLADNGICCIDEFDKMDGKDQVAIHEAMEQQTISIAKAGIQATLNARTSILAAANPVLGRYDKSKSLKYNIDLSAPIMSRFDLFFIIVDEKDDNTDFHIAQHIVSQHQFRGASLHPHFSTQQLQNYIRFARTLKPRLTKPAAQLLLESYVQLRKSDVGFQKTAYRITVRQLESLTRLSEAVARVHLENIITPQHVEEACRLLKKSIINVEAGDVELEEPEYYQQRDREEAIARPDPLQEEGVRQKQTVSFDEYERITCEIAKFVSLTEREHGIVRQHDITDWFVENNINLIESEEDARNLTNKINAIIRRLIEVDSILVIIQLNNICSWLQRRERERLTECSP